MSPKLLLETGKIDEATTALEEAIEDYRAVGETLNEARARILRIAVLEKRGQLDAAIACARDAADFSSEKGHALVTSHAYLELGRVLVVAGRAAEALEVLRRALSSAVLLADRNAEFQLREHRGPARSLHRSPRILSSGGEGVES